jgi:TDG/mug DNA glycosylase family protein
MFWRCLNQSGLVPERLGPADGERLLEFGIGLTDIVKRPTHDAAELRPEEFRTGRELLREKLTAHAPLSVCFVGKLAWQHYLGRARTGPFGQQPERIGAAVVFVMPSTSGLVNNLHAERLRCLEEVRAFLGR